MKRRYSRRSRKTYRRKKVYRKRARKQRDNYMSTKVRQQFDVVASGDDSTEVFINLLGNTLPANFAVSIALGSYAELGSISTFFK